MKSASKEVVRNPCMGEQLYERWRGLVMEAVLLVPPGSEPSEWWKLQPHERGAWDRAARQLYHKTFMLAENGT